MQIEERIVTVTCSAKDCEHRAIAAGKRAKVDLALQGWELDLGLFEHKIDLCPDCTAELREWSGVAALEWGEPKTAPNDYDSVYSDGAVPLSDDPIFDHADDGTIIDTGEHS